MIDLIAKGGIFMYPIIFCSVVALAVLLERLWVLRRKQIIPEDFVRHVEELLKKTKGLRGYLLLSDRRIIHRQNFSRRP